MILGNQGKKVEFSTWKISVFTTLNIILSCFLNKKIKLMEQAMKFFKNKTGSRNF